MCAQKHKILSEAFVFGWFYGFFSPYVESFHLSRVELRTLCWHWEPEAEEPEHISWSSAEERLKESNIPDTWRDRPDRILDLVLPWSIAAVIWAMRLPLTWLAVKTTKYRISHQWAAPTTEAYFNLRGFKNEQGFVPSAWFLWSRTASEKTHFVFPGLSNFEHLSYFKVTSKAPGSPSTAPHIQERQRALITICYLVNPPHQID